MLNKNHQVNLLIYIILLFSPRFSDPPPDQSKTKSNTPVGFPTSKIVIPSVQTSRVGLSRKSGAIKSLHPNLNQRIVHE